LLPQLGAIFFQKSHGDLGDFAGDGERRSGRAAARWRRRGGDRRGRWRRRAPFPDRRSEGGFLVGRLDFGQVALHFVHALFDVRHHLHGFSMNDGVSGVKHETVGEHEHDFPLELGKRGNLSRTNAGFNLGDVRRILHDPGVIARVSILDGFLKQSAMFVLQEAI